MSPVSRESDPTPQHEPKPFRRRVSEEAAQRILRMIIDREFSPGERLPSEREFADRLGVSRASLRDALRVLEADGILAVRVGSGGGTFVTVPDASRASRALERLLQMSVATPEHVAEARLVMELSLVELVLERADASDIDALRRLCEDAEDALANGSYGPGHSESFHRRLAAATHNPAVAHLAASFAGPLSMVLVRERADPDARHARSIAYHRRIADAVEARDADALTRLIREHLRDDAGA